MVKFCFYLGMVDMAEDEDWPPTAPDDIADAALPVMFNELLEDEFDISPP